MIFYQKNIEPILHGLFWSMPLILFFSIMSNILPLEKAFLLSIVSTTILASICYLNIFYAIPTFFRKQKFGSYTTALITLLALSTFSHFHLFEFIFSDTFQNPSPLFKKRMQMEKDFPALRIIPIFFTSVIFLFISTIFQLAKEFRKKERLNNLLEKEKIKHELNFLRNQINPHFLLNALNNIHATTQIKPEKTSEYILRLGEMLRYVLEDCSKDKVWLSDEINYIRNYVFFQQQKDQLLENIQLSLAEGTNQKKFKLEPMLFAPIVENAFQHNYLQDSKNQWVNIKLNTLPDRIEFTVRNNLGEKIQSNGTNRNQTGIGIQNIKRRLDLLYPNQHLISFQKKENEFEAKLLIYKQEL